VALPDPKREKCSTAGKVEFTFPARRYRIFCFFTPREGVGANFLHICYLLDLPYNFAQDTNPLEAT
jgi:hypothetical protein